MGVIVPTALAVLVAERLYAVGMWNLPTAQAILREAGPTNVLLGASLSFVAAVGHVALWIGVLTFTYRATRGQGYGKLPVEVPSILFALGALLLFTVAPIVSVAIGVPILLFTGLRGWRDRRAGVTRRYNWQVVGTWVMQIAVATYLLSTTPWMPREIITVNGSQPLLGYVLNEGERTAILLDSPRVVTYVMQSDIVQRQICLPAGRTTWTRSLPDVAGWSDKTADSAYPDCPQ